MSHNKNLSYSDSIGKLVKVNKEMLKNLTEHMMDKTGPFKKADIGKIKPVLIPPEFLELVAPLLEHGANKYGNTNWKNCTDLDRYRNALYRHWLAYLKDNKSVDVETGYSHLRHAACCLIFLVCLEEI